MQRSLPSVGSLAHTTSRTTRTENPARCRLLDARLHDYTTPNTTRRPTQHDAQHNTTPNTPRSTERNTRSATHVCRQPAIPRPTRVPQYTRPLLQHPHTMAPTPPTRPPPMIIAEHFGIWLWFFVGALVSCLVRFSLGPVVMRPVPVLYLEPSNPPVCGLRRRRHPPVSQRRAFTVGSRSRLCLSDLFAVRKRKRQKPARDSPLS